MFLHSQGLLSCVLSAVLLLPLLLDQGRCRLHKRLFIAGDPSSLIVPPDQNDVENELLTYYNADNESAEIVAHSNRVFKCEDHSLAKEVCARARRSCFCQEHEAYAFSFCRRSCEFCNPNPYGPKLVWRVVAASFFEPTWMVRDVEFLSDSMEDDSPIIVVKAIASSEYPGYSVSHAFDNDTATYWMPQMWGPHEPNSTWLGARLDKGRKINEIRLATNSREWSSVPKVIHIQAADSIIGPFVHRWAVYTDKLANPNVLTFASCPVLWHKYEAEDDNYCFRLFAKHLTWEKAEYMCQTHSSHLASIRDQQELQFVTTKLHLCGPVWTGLNDQKTEGSYVWTDKTDFNFSNWAIDEPLDELRNDEEDCVVMNYKGEWTTSSCHNTHFYMCKKPIAYYVEPENDAEEPELFPPVIFHHDNYYRPLRNVSETFEKLQNYTLTWPVLKGVPVNKAGRQGMVVRNMSLLANDPAVNMTRIYKSRMFNSKEVSLT